MGNEEIIINPCAKCGSINFKILRFGIIECDDCKNIEVSFRGRRN